ncbi:MAG: FAD-dependent oxidoreductase [Caulobacterales bacterium]
MRGCDVAIVGLGVMGSAALHALARQGVDVLGFDPLAVGAARGSSHGSCRIFRRFNFESPAYTALSDQAHAAWRALEAESGARVLIPCPVLEAGPPGSAMVAASRAAAESAGGYAGPSRGSEIASRFPAFALPPDWDVVVQDGGAILLAEEAVRLFRAAAPDRIIGQAVRFAPGPTGIVLTTASGDQYQAKTLILAAGPWIVNLLPKLRAHVTITRQAVGWFQPAEPRTAGPGDFPIFILEAPLGLVYGFPDFEGRGVKAALHDHGPRVGPDDWGPPPSDAELAPVSETLESFVPGAFGRIVDRDVCLYANTGPGDADGSATEEFIIDRLPDDPRIIVASPCSGPASSSPAPSGRCWRAW